MNSIPNNMRPRKIETWVIFAVVLLCVNLNPVSIFCQNAFDGIGYYDIDIDYGKDILKYKTYLPDKKMIRDELNYKIPQLIYVADNWFEPLKLCRIRVNYNYVRNDEMNEECYYGGIKLKVSRYLKLLETDEFVFSEIFNEEFYVSLTNPTNEMIGNDALQIMDALIDKLGLFYYKKD